MSLYVRNSTNDTVWFAYGYHSPGCGGVAWAKKGWWQIGPGGTATVRGGWTGGATYFSFAESSSGLQWGGEYFTNLPSQAFEWCWNTGSTSGRVLGMRGFVVPISIANHTINLTR
jgi:uncharacterized membrane protein